MDTKRETKKRRLHEERKGKSLTQTQLSEMSNHTVDVGSQERSQFWEMNTTTTVDEDAASTCGNSQTVHEKTDEKRAVIEVKEENSEMYGSCSMFWESDCQTQWIGESSCLSVNGPAVQSSSFTVNQSFDRQEQEEVTSLSAAALLSQQMRTSLKLTQPNTAAISSSSSIPFITDCRKKPQSVVSSSLDDGEDAFADEEWEITDDYVPSPYNVALDWEE